MKSTFIQPKLISEIHGIRRLSRLTINTLVRHLLLTIYMMFWLYFSFTNGMNDATTNEIKLSKADLNNPNMVENFETLNV